jgi:hypothetical protein
VRYSCLIGVEPITRSHILSPKKDHKKEKKEKERKTKKERKEKKKK